MGDADGTGFDFERSMEMAAPRGAPLQGRAAPFATNVGPAWNNDVPHQSGGGAPVFAPAKRNFRQTVCRHWLRSLCMKGDQCGFLHQYDKSRMPVCRFFAKWGECREPDCPYKHTLEDIKECNMYKLGFCPNGLECRYRHQKLPGPPPPVEQHLQRLQHRIFSQSGPSQPRHNNANVNAPQPSPSEHPSQHPSQHQPWVGEGNKSSQAASAAVPRQPSSASPIPPGPTRYFIVKSNNMDNLELSAQRGMWATHRNNEFKLNEAFEMCANVILIFSVNETRHFQGFAKMISRIEGVPGEGGGWKYAHGIANYGKNFAIKWLKMCELSFHKTASLKNPFNDHLPVKVSRDCQEVERTVAEQLLLLLASQPDSPLMETARSSQAAREQRQARGGGPELETDKAAIVPFEEGDEEDEEEEEEEEEEVEEEAAAMSGRGQGGGGRGQGWGGYGQPFSGPGRGMGMGQGTGVGPGMLPPNYGMPPGLYGGPMGGRMGPGGPGNYGGMPEFSGQGMNFHPDYPLGPYHEFGPGYGNGPPMGFRGPPGPGGPMFGGGPMPGMGMPHFMG